MRARGSGEVFFGFVELEKARQAGRLMRKLKEQIQQFQEQDMVGHRCHGPQRDKSVAKLLLEWDDVEAVLPI